MLYLCAVISRRIIMFNIKKNCDMIITEKEKSKIVLSSLLERHYPELKLELWDIIGTYHKGMGTVSHTKDYWVRDFMPIQMDEYVFVKFVYNPDYLQDKKKYITNVDKVIKNCPFAQNYEIVDIPFVVDGGNMVFCKGKKKGKETEYVVMTEKVFNENPSFSKEQIECLLKCAFQSPDLTIVWLPWDKEDIFGHTDGIVRYVGISKSGKPQVLVNLQLYDDKIAQEMYSSLAKHFEVIELELSKYDDLSWAYINSLQTCDFIIIPGLGDEVTDAETLAQYKQLYPEYEDNIYQVQMRDFIAENGGALNCLTWTIYENYLKVLAKCARIPIIDLEDNKKDQIKNKIDDMLKTKCKR